MHVLKLLYNLTVKRVFAFMVDLALICKYHRFSATHLDFACITVADCLDRLVDDFVENRGWDNVFHAKDKVGKGSLDIFVAEVGNFLNRIPSF